MFLQFIDTMPLSGNLEKYKIYVYDEMISKSYS